MDHSCSSTTNGACPPTTNSPFVGPIPKAGAFQRFGAQDVQPFQPVVSPSSGAIAGWMSSDNPSLPHAAAVVAGPPSLVQPSNARSCFPQASKDTIRCARDGLSAVVYKLWSCTFGPCFNCRSQALKWQPSERSLSCKATLYVAPQLWQPPSGTPMKNDMSDIKPAEESAASFALSKNDSYVMSVSGGKVSLFNMMTIKVMTTFMALPPGATLLVFHPHDNNIIAIGMEDSSIQIYNVRVDEVKTKLKGQQNQITGLAFLLTLNSMVSSGADAELCLWSIDGWEKRNRGLYQHQLVINLR